MNDEIERKFLLDHIPELLKRKSKIHVKQGYLSIEKKREVRMRQMNNHYFQTVKKGAGLHREEYEIRLNRKQFESLWPATEGRRLEKVRSISEWENHTLEIDRFRGELQGLLTAEVEFKSRIDAINFTIPPFFGEEVTYDERYRNQNLSRTGSSDLKQLLPSGMEDGIVGTIPYLKEQGILKVVMITRRSNNHWIFPKGQQESKKSLQQVALIEAQEEAGIQGALTRSPIRVPYKKGHSHINMLCFPIEVRKLKKNWDERHERERKVVSIAEAYKMTDQPAVHASLRYLEQMGF